MEERKIMLNDSEIPRQWYNIMPDMPTPMNPPLHPGTGKPVGPQDLAPIFPMNIIEQEVSTERLITIPDEVLDKYLLYRPTPLRRALNFEKALKCPVKIYYKDESVSPPAPTSLIRPSRRPITTRSSGSRNSRRRRARDSGEAPWPWPARCSAWSARSSWSA